MRGFRAFLLRLGGFLRRESWERELDAELKSNLELHVEDNIRAGMSPEEARRAALVRFGSVAAAKDRYRDRKLFPSLDDLLRDVRYAVRMLSRTPGSSFAIVLLLGLGLGANATVFSLMNAVFLRPLPAIDDPGALVRVARDSNQGRFRTMFSYPEYVELLDSSRSYSSMAGHYMSPFSFAAEGGTERVMGEYVTSNYFKTLGVQAAIGLAALDSQGDSVVISYRLWQRSFAGEPAVIGKTVFVNGQPMVVAGVAEQGYQGVYLPTGLDLYLPLSFRGSETLQRSDNAPVRLIGRLKPGVDRGQAQAELEVIAERWHADRPDEERTRLVADAYRAAPFSPASRARALQFFYILVAATVLTMLVICANVANLMLARATVRGREMAVRAALGAGRARIVRQALIEGLLLSAAGAALSILVAANSVEPLFSFVPGDDGAPVTIDLSLDWRVFGDVTLLSLAAALAFTLPALKATRPNVWELLRAGETAVVGGRSRIRAALTVGQVALCFVLLAGSGLLIRSLHLLESIDTGLTTAHVTLASLDPDLTRNQAGRYDPGVSMTFDDTEAQHQYEGAIQRLYQAIQRRVVRIPGVESAALAATIPLGGASTSMGDVHGGAVAATDALRGTCNIVTPGYFETMGIPILGGRRFLSSDNEENSRVVIVNETLARRLWPDGSAVGQILYVGGATGDHTWRIVGVARDVANRLRAEPREFYYVPHAQRPRSRMTLHARSSIGPGVLLPAMRNAVADVDPHLPLYNIRTLRAVRLKSYWEPRMASAIVSFSAAIALLLAAIGLFAEISSRVARRTREIGVRMALGASVGRIRRGVLWESSLLCVVGVAVGAALAVAATETLASLLYGVTPTDPITFAGVLLVLVLVTMLASYLPARRATSIDPVSALRCD